jgi:hypothetical protein
MGRKRRGIGAAFAAALLLTSISAAAHTTAQRRVVAQSQSTTPVVSAFFVLPRYVATAPQILIGVRVRGVTRDEHVTTACSSCGRTKLVETAIHRSEVTLTAKPSVRMGPSTRIIIGVTSPGSNGRWIVVGFPNGQYKGLGHGCMSPRVTSLTPRTAAHPVTIPSASCGPASPRGHEYVYWTGRDTQLYEYQYWPPHWLRRLAIGSGYGVESAPAVVVRPNGERDVFWRGAGGGLWVMSYTGFWSNAVHLRSAGKLKSDPAASVDAHGVVRVFWQGTDGWLHDMSVADRGLAGVRPLNSGPVASAPAVVSRPGHPPELFWRGTDGGLYEMADGRDAYGRLIPTAGTLDSAPTAISDHRGVEHVFWRSANGSLVEISGSGSQWSAPRELARGPLDSPPSAVIHIDGVQDVFWEGAFGELWEQKFAKQKWGNPLPLPGAGVLGSRPAAAVGLPTSAGK